MSVSLTGSPKTGGLGWLFPCLFLSKKQTTAEAMESGQGWYKNQQFQDTGQWVCFIQHGKHVLMWYCLWFVHLPWLATQPFRLSNIHGHFQAKSEDCDPLARWEKYAIIPLAYSVHLESYNNMELLWEAARYKPYLWNLCKDLMVIGLLMQAVSWSTVAFSDVRIVRLYPNTTSKRTGGLGTLF